MKQIPLTKGKFTLVDDDVYEWAKDYNWFVSKNCNTWYAHRMTSRKDDPESKQHVIQLHRMIMDCSKDLKIDHIDGNGLNNQRFNLRIATDRQNSQNKISHRNGRLVGCQFRKDLVSKPWMARIVIDRKTKYLGYYATEQEASAAYFKALEELCQ
jgi:hypothetical protein